MKLTNQFNIYVGKTGIPETPVRPNVIPEKWKPILALAYAYTTYSINNSLLDISSLTAMVNDHENDISKLENDVAALSVLTDEEFVEQINSLVGKIDKMDPDTLLLLSYSYTLLNSDKVYYDSYSYSYILYDDAITRAYEYTDIAHADALYETNRLNQYVNNNFIRKTTADERYAYKDDIPTNISQLNNDSQFITSSALSSYITRDDVDSRIQNIIGTAPDALDTLEEIAYSLDNDPNLKNTLTNLINTKADKEYVDYEISKNVARQDDIPIYDSEKIQELIDAGPEFLPNKYITIDSGNEVLDKTEAGNYLDIIFSTLRALQTEVTKIKNTFKSGIMSLTNENTHMSEVVHDYTNIDDEEPLWAVDPDTLTEVSGTEFFIDTAHTLTPTANVTVATNKLIIEQSAVWEDNRINITSGEPTNYMHDNEDAKQYVYITSSTTNVQIQLTNYVDDSKTIIVNLNELNIPVTESHKYNILLCVSRSVKNNSGTYVGENFIYLIVADYFTGDEVLSGYINNGILRDTLRTGRLIGGTLEERRYYISKITFTDLELYRMTFYSKFQEFNSDVLPTVPVHDDTYSVAHITIRSVKNIEQLKKIKDQLLENELVYNDSNNCIYIIKNNEIKLISGGGSNVDPDDDITGMEREEILEWLESNGIIGLTRTDDETFDKLSFNSVGDITFVNELNEKFKFSVDTDGELHSMRLTDESMVDRVNKSGMPINETTTSFTNTRGFIGTLREYELGIKPSNMGDNTSDMRLNSDRIKIGNVYAPWPNSNVHGCTHAYIELENTSNIDYPLDGCYIHFARRNNDELNTVDEYSLPLKGIIPAGGTYLIRCKKYADIEQANTFINVDSFDIEWITADGELLDPYLGIQNTFLLTYGCPGQDRDPNSTFNYTVSMTAVGTGALNGIRVWHPCYIDSISIKSDITATYPSGSPSWGNWAAHKGLYAVKENVDALYKTTFELDPAKQAYQGLNAKDSSRVRSDKVTDYQTVYLQNEYIEFPKTDEKYPVSMYTPMASYLHKNVTTDKTKLDMNRPNMTTVAFGIDMLKTRCFNWISAGDFDEYVWIREKTDTNSAEWKRFESYKERTDDDTTYSEYINNAKTAPYRKEFTYMTNNAVYARIHKSFPGSGVKYTSHKCIIDVVDTPVNSKTTYEYIVGRGDKNKNPDPEHTSDIMTFILYPASYEPRLYQTTDQQGFHWIEYQTWGAAADYINNLIIDQCNSENIIPVVLNTGDATQNGTRVNEWLDYYIGGKNLFNHLEQMSIVGNNDLCDNDPEILGTGDDSGKSNGFYHHVFYCYEVDEKLNDGTYPKADDDPIELLNNMSFKYLPLIKGNDDVIRYVPSFYWFGTNKYTFVMMNSELTYVNCGKWFKRTKLNPEINTEQTVNLYTGWTVPAKDEAKTYVYDNEFTTIYTMLYNVINEHKTSKESSGTDIKNLIVACHEMPFTVVTAANLKTSTASSDRSLNGKTSLVGSHMNKLNNLDDKANYWFSRLLEYFGVKFCYGGHKHTYAITNEIRENYRYKVDGETKYSILDGKMTMTNDLSGDTAEFEFNFTKFKTIDNKFNLTLNLDKVDAATNDDIYKIATSKFPIMKKSDDVSNADNDLLGIIINGDTLFPYYGINNNVNGVIYMMCQATGFKLKSNKELPGPNQKFSYIIPETVVKPSGDTPSAEQQHPMFTEIHPDTHNAYLMRLENIHNGSNILTQIDYSTKPINMKYLYRTGSIDMYGAWTETRKQLLSW